MASWKEGDRVRVLTRATTAEDRKSNRYFPHMAGLPGVVTNVYSKEEVAVRVDPDALTGGMADVHATATVRMREKFLGNISEEQKKGLTKEELEFDANYVVLVAAADLEKA